MSQNSIYKFSKKIIRHERSLTGKGNLRTLKEIKKINKGLKIKHFKSGTNVFDWIVPNEWTVRKAFIITPEGKKICDYKKNNLYLVGYSQPKNIDISEKKLQKHIHSLKKQPNAIPYVTSYYKKTWGFCIEENLRKKFKKGTYKVLIDSKFKKGKMAYGEVVFKGKTKKEILLSTYICHPEMANNETSGISVLTFLANWIKKKRRKFTYRIIFIPETIGAIAYINRNLIDLKKNLIAGYIITCVGDENSFSYIPSRQGDTASDYVAKLILKKHTKKYKTYSWLDRGSDERQFCSPGIDLPVCSITKTKYGKYKEYHTSLDKLDSVVTSKGLNESFNMYKKLITYFEENKDFDSFFPKSIYPCEPHLSKRNLYPTISIKNQNSYIRNLMNILSYCDGKKSINQIASITKNTIETTNKILTLLKKEKIII